jgi:hypothetical protein
VCVSRTGETVAGFDARERVTAAAFELHARVTAESAVYGHPGFVPGGFTAGRSRQAAAAVAELCAAGVWEPVADGYRVLDQDAVRVRCQNSCRVSDLGSYPRHSCSSASSTC